MGTDVPNPKPPPTLPPPPACKELAKFLCDPTLTEEEAAITAEIRKSEEKNPRTPAKYRPLI